MPQGKKTYFDHVDLESSRPPKRKAEMAFAEKNLPSPSPRSNDQKVKLRRPPTGKVVNFQDGQDNTKTMNRHDSIRPSEDAQRLQMGRLRQKSRDLLPIRQSLPIYSHADEIKSKLGDNDVLLLVGETGSGKSTQVPQFLLGQVRRVPGRHGSKIGGCIAITQPRRVAAISLARRIAEEMGTPLGNSSPASQVGYSVRFDNSTSPGTRVKFLTDGMLLQELLRDPWLKDYSVVVVDEVHERGVNVDLVLGFLKKIVEGRNEKDGRGGVPLKIVVMSATADMERIEKFFLSSNGEVKEEEKEKEDTGETGADVEDGSVESGQQRTVQPIRLTSCFIKGRQYPVTINYTSQPVTSSWDAALERIVQIHQHTPLPGDILVFLPGQEAIDSLESMCNTYANTLAQQSKQKGAPKIPKLLILPLFAALPTAAQQRVFESTPPFTRKIILSTNIAETSVTVPGIRHVIDTGKRKARFFRPSLNLDTLLTKPVSRSSAKQRAGRAGREAPGTCWRLYTEKTFYELEADTEPEILRCDLSQLVLTLKAHNIDDILSFPLLTQPPIKALERALIHLLHLKALDPRTGHITALGRQMSSLPLPANLARVLLASIEPQYDCLDEIIDIVSGLSVENIWLPIHNQRSTQTDPDSSAFPQDEDEDTITNPVLLARRTLQRRSGDHMTLLAAIQSYTNESTDRKSWCRTHGISHRAMSAAMDIRKQLTKLMVEGGRYRPNANFTSKPKSKPKSEPECESDKPQQAAPSTPSPSPPPPPPPTLSTTHDLEPRILKTLLTGLHTNTAHLSPHTYSTSTSSTSNSTSPKPTPQLTAPYKTYYTAKPLHIHPSSILFSREKASQAPDIVFSEFVYTSRPYARCVSSVEGAWVEDVMKGLETLNPLEGGRE